MNQTEALIELAQAVFKRAGHTEFANIFQITAVFTSVVEGDCNGRFDLEELEAVAGSVLHEMEGLGADFVGDYERQLVEAALQDVCKIVALEEARARHKATGQKDPAAFDFGFSQFRPRAA